MYKLTDRALFWLAITFFVLWALTWGIAVSYGEDIYVQGTGQTSGRVLLSGGSYPLLSTDSTSNTLNLSSGWTVKIGDLRLDDSTTTGGATLVGTLDEFDNSDSTNVQDVLDDLDEALSGVSTVSSLDDLSDVTITGPLQTRDALMYDGVSSFVDRPLVEADISDLGTYLTAVTLADVAGDSSTTADQTFALDASTQLIFEDSTGADIVAVDEATPYWNFFDTPLLFQGATAADALKWVWGGGSSAYASLNIQPNAGNRDAVLRFLPSGTADSGVLEFFAGSDTTNYLRLQQKSFSTHYVFDSQYGGTQTAALPIQFNVVVSGVDTPAIEIDPQADVLIGHSALSTATEALDVNGGIKLGAADGTADGTIQWTGAALQGRVGGAWVDLAQSGGASTLDDLDNVTITGPLAARDALMYDGVSAFVDRPLVEADISDLQAYLTEESDPVFGAMDTEGELETQLGGLDVFTENDTIPEANIDADIARDSELPVGANPSATVNGTVTNGSASTFLRSDGAPALADPFTPADGTQNITGALTTSGAVTAGGTGLVFDTETTNATRYIRISDTRTMIGHDAASGNTVIQGGLGKGIEFNVGNATFGSGTVGTISTTGNLTMTGSGTFEGTVTTTGIIGPADSNVTSKSDANFIFELDDDNDSAAGAFTVKNSADAAAHILYENGNYSSIGTITIDGDINVNGGLIDSGGDIKNDPNRGGGGFTLLGDYTDGDDVVVPDKMYFGGSKAAATEYAIYVDGSSNLAISSDEVGSSNYGIVLNPGAVSEVNISGGLALNVASPTALTGNINNWSIANSTAIARISSDGAYDITGIAATNRANGSILILTNIGSFALTLKNENASSTAANRLAIGADIGISPARTQILWYDTTSSRWRRG